MGKSRQTRLQYLLERLHTVADGLEELATECEDSLGNIEGTNLENTERNQRLAEATGTLRDQADAVNDAASELDGVEF